MALSVAIKEPMFFKAKNVALARAEHVTHISTSNSGRSGAGKEIRQTTAAVFDVPGYGAYAVAWPRGQAPSAIENAASANPGDKPAFVYFAVPAPGEAGSFFALSRPLQNALAFLAFFSALGLFAEMLGRKKLRPEHMPAGRYLALAHAAALAAAALLLFAAPLAA